MTDSGRDQRRPGEGISLTDGIAEHLDGQAEQGASDAPHPEGTEELEGYRGAVAARAAGISYRQLDYWARTGLVEPTVRGAAGSGTQRLYGFRDILVLKLVKRLLDTGISLQQIRTAVNQLRESGIRDLSQTTLMSDGASVYLCTSTDEVIDLVNRGQGVFGIAVGKVLEEVEHTLIEFDTEIADPMDELAARRARRVS